MTSMLLNSVILILVETLEVALLVSVLSAICFQLRSRTIWLPFGSLAGIVFALWYASQMGAVSEWFDYVGQEIINALLEVLVTLMMAVCAWVFVQNQETHARSDPVLSHDALLFTFSAAGTVALAVTREGSEILLYLNGFFQQSESFEPVMIGTAIGFGIGVSVGILFYYGLLSLGPGLRSKALILFLALFSGNMLSQAVLQLNQADWISSAQAIWDTSAWLPEDSISGRLLYALVGYEATPSTLQIVAYAAGVALVLSPGIASRLISKHV